MSDDSLAQELMEESGETSQEIVDLELRLFASLISDKQGIRQYLVKNLHQHEAFDFIPNAWKAAINSAQEGQVFTLETFLHLPDLTQIEKGMIESANYVPACNSIEEVEILSTQVKEKYFRNKLIKAISTPVSELSQGQLSVSDALGQLARELESISGETANTDSLGLGVGHNAMAVADAVLTESNLSIIPTGITGYDEKAGGAAKGEQIIVACPTSSGKTTFMNQLCINMGLGMVGREYKGTPRSVLYISLEMSEEEMWKRILANLCAIEVSQFRRPETFTDEQRAFIKETLVNLSNYLARVGHRFTLRGASSADIQSIRAELAAHPYDILCVDYLNLMAEGDQLWSEMGKIARELKILAQRRDFVCITAAQLDEDSLKIRYSRMVKEHCDTVLMWNLVRPEGQQEEVSSAYTEIFVDKGRNTGKFSFWVHFNFKYMMVTPVNPSQQLGLYQSPAAGQALPLPGANSIGVTHQGAQLALPNNSQPSTITQQALSPHLSAPPQQAAAQSSPLSPPVAQAAAPQQSAIDILNTSVGALTEDKGPLPGQANELDELVDARRVDMPGSLPAGVLSPNFDAFKAGDSPSGVTTMLQDIQAEAELEEVSQYDRDNVIEL